VDTRLSLHSSKSINTGCITLPISLGEGSTLLSINDYDAVSYDGDNNISISIKESIVETNLADRWMLMRMKMIGKDC